MLTVIIANHSVDTKYEVIKEIAETVFDWYVYELPESENYTPDFDLYWSDLNITNERLSKLKPY